MSKIAIKTEKLTKDFSGKSVVSNLSLEVPSGTVFGFLGPNGSGKTTTIHMLLGLVEPSGGSIEVLGFNARSQADEIRSRTGVLLEFHGLYERLTAMDNLDFYGKIWRMGAAERKARTRELLTHIGLWERRNDTVGTWSRGMKQKLAIARAMIHRPALLFLDEPSAGLDPVAADALRDDIAMLATRENATVFLTTHNLAEAEKLCARIGIINKGMLIACGRPDEIRSAPDRTRIEVVGRGFTQALAESLMATEGVMSVKQYRDRMLIDMQGERSAAGLINLITGSGAEIEEVLKDRASLEDVFKELLEEQ